MSCGLNIDIVGVGVWLLVLAIFVSDCRYIKREQ